MRYLSDDGKVFQTAEECVEHEKKNSQKEKEKRQKEIQEAGEKYFKLIDNYKKDFGIETDTKDEHDFTQLLKLLTLM